MKTAFVLMLLVGLGAGGVAYYQGFGHQRATPKFRTASITRGDLNTTIGATGTVEPEEVVDVGAQVAGRIIALGRDPERDDKTIDYGSTVHTGTVLATIDDAVYRAHRDQANASLERARADLQQLEAKRKQTDSERKRADELRQGKGKIKAISDTDYDLAVANHETAVANVEVGKAVIDQAEAALRLAETNLQYTVIRSPVEGVIVDRRVNVGQTVVASLNAPSLFLIAKDLSKVQVWASVNEADIGQIRSRPNMPVRFTVDAYPREVFRGEVQQVRYNATFTQNIVTYTVVVACENSDLRLLPYLTANLVFEVDERRGVLKVPNAALRWKPRPEQMVPELREAAPAEKDRRGDAKADGEASRLWIVEGDFVRSIEVEIGASDGATTEISGSEVKEGLEVAIGEVRQDASADSETTVPFAPRMNRSKKGPS